MQANLVKHVRGSYGECLASWITVFHSGYNPHWLRRNDLSLGRLRDDIIDYLVLA